MKEFENKVAIVTGTTGIGRAIALRLAAGGANVMACGIDAAANRELQQISDAQHATLRVELCDVSIPEQVKVRRRQNRRKIRRPRFHRQCCGLSSLRE